MKLLYSLSPEIYLINALPGVEANIEESAICKEVKEKGSDIHVKRGNRQGKKENCEGEVILRCDYFYLGRMRSSFILCLFNDSTIYSRS